MEDAPIKKVDGNYFLVNFEEAWLTLGIDISDSMSSRMYDTVIEILSQSKKHEVYQSQPQTSIFRRLIYNYIYFAETGSEREIINSQVKAILEFGKTPGCKDVILNSLSHFAEAAPIETLNFIESELDHGVIAQAFSEADSWSGNYTNVLWALDKLVMRDESAIRACRILYKLCKIHREYHTSNSPKDSLLNALCLWDNHTAVTIKEKKQFAIGFIDDNSSFGVPFAIELINKNNVFRGVRPGEKERRFESVTTNDLYLAYKDIASSVLNTSIKEKRVEWIEKALLSYGKIPPDAFISSTELLTKANFSPEKRMLIIYQIKSLLFSINKYNREDRNEWIVPLNKWADCLVTDDPVSKEGWRFYKYYSAPFPEVISESKDDYLKEEQRTLEIRKQVFTEVKEKQGIDLAVRLVDCMGDDRAWGVFLKECLTGKEFIQVAKHVASYGKKQLLSGLISTVDLPDATEIYSVLSQEDRESILPLLIRDDIDEWLNTPEQQQLYWKSKRLNKYDDRSYHYLLKYNPCGILPIFLNREEMENAFDRLIEVVHAIIDSTNYSDVGLLTLIVQQFDAHNYSEEWAELCIELYKQDVFKYSYGYYPACLQIFFFRHPEKIVEEYNDDAVTFYGHFNNDYSLPDEAYEDQEAFIAWTNYLYDIAKEEPTFVSTLGVILGRSVLGKDGIFPHEYIRSILEKYSNDALTRSVAIGWFNARGVRWVQDGFDEQKQELIYREQARSLEFSYPQTAKLLCMLAEDYRREAKEDRQYAESFPL